MVQRTGIQSCNSASPRQHLSALSRSVANCLRISLPRRHFPFPRTGAITSVRISLPAGYALNGSLLEAFYA